MSPEHDTLQQRLRASLDEVSAPVDVDDVLSSVERRRAAMQTGPGPRRATRAGIAVLAAAAVLTVVVVLAERPDTESLEVAGPDPAPTSTAPVLPEPDEPLRVVDLPDEVVAVLGSDRTGFWVATDSRRVTWIGLDGVPGPPTELVGVARLAATDGTHLYVLVEEQDVGSQPWRLKRIDPANGRMLDSQVAPIVGSPTALVAAAGSVTIVTDTATLVMDAAGRVLDTGPAPLQGATRSVLFVDGQPWGLGDDGRLLRNDADGRTVATQIDGVRALLSADGIDDAPIALERLVDGELRVQLLLGDGTLRTTARLADDDRAAALTGEAVWVLRGGVVQLVDP